LLITESQWYKELIEENLGLRNTASVAVWPYPIDPIPAGPKECKYNLLIYAKSGHTEKDIGYLQSMYPRSIVIQYGKYKRDELLSAAQQSRCCSYISDDDRGPLALAEIMLSGCPVAGVAHGAPWIIDGLTGYQSRGTAAIELIEAIDLAIDLDRPTVRDIAVGMFNAEAVVSAVVESLGPLVA
jgi:hypothetical protein